MDDLHKVPAARAAAADGQRRVGVLAVHVDVLVSVHAAALRGVNAHADGLASGASDGQHLHSRGRVVLVKEGKVKVELTGQVKRHGYRLPGKQRPRVLAKVGRVRAVGLSEVVHHVKHLLRLVASLRVSVTEVHADCADGATNEEGAVCRLAAGHRHHEEGQRGVGLRDRESDVGAVGLDARVGGVQLHSHDLRRARRQLHVAVMKIEARGVLIKLVQLVAVHAVAPHPAKEVPVVAQAGGRGAVQLPGVVLRQDHLREYWLVDGDGEAGRGGCPVDGPVDVKLGRGAIAHKDQQVGAVVVVMEHLEQEAVVVRGESHLVGITASGEAVAKLVARLESHCHEGTGGGGGHGVGRVNGGLLRDGRGLDEQRVREHRHGGDPLQVQAKPAGQGGRDGAQNGAHAAHRGAPLPVVGDGGKGRLVSVLPRAKGLKHVFVVFAGRGKV
mmetsp:Transcript_27294/g.77021  ORF Transcript_27294/g.77021 Transcript_27294/m.77021 type:complete len:443 (+) Transcript_27294:1319-2647(+)